MKEWTEFVIALSIFLFSHFLPSRSSLRDRLILAIGRRPYFTIYGLVSLAILGWLILAAGRAPYVEFWPQLPWHRWVPNLVMPIALLLCAFGIGMSYPFSLGGKRSATFDPMRPGIAAVTRHPVLLALTFWSGAHLVANGDLAHVAMFGTFSLFSLTAIVISDKRAMRSLGNTRWQEIRKTTGVFRVKALGSVVTDLSARATLLRLSLAIGIYAAIVWFHSSLVGTSPLPS